MLQNLRNEYAKAISRWQVKNPDLDYLSIWKSYNPNTWTEEQLNGLSIEHTLWCCDNSKCKKGGILITGINPSFNKYFYSPDATFFETANTNGSDYWSTKKNMVDIFRGGGSRISRPVSDKDDFTKRFYESLKSATTRLI